MQPTLIATERARRKRNASKPEQEKVISPSLKVRVVALLEEGATITEMFRTAGMPSVRSFWRARESDPDFDNACRMAQVRGAEIKLALAMENAEREAESRDPDRARVAQSLCAVTTTYAEKIAPKEFGQLVKLGGDPNAPLAVQVINYSTLQGGALTPVDTANHDTTRAQEEIAAPLRNDAAATEGGKRESKALVRPIRPGTSRRRLAQGDRQKAKAKARNKAS